MTSPPQILLTAACALCALSTISRPLQAAATLGASYYALSESDPDVGNSQGQGSLLTAIGAGLGPNGLPIVDTSTPQGAQLHDVNSATHELEWWSPALNSNVTVLNNPVYPSAISLPFVDDNMYTNTTVLGENGDDARAFLTAKFTGVFSLPSNGTVSFNACSDDDEFVFVSGGVFGAGTLVVDNGGLHGLGCSSGNVNTGLLSDVAAGNYTLTVFYDDRERTGAAFELSSTLDLAPPTPPSSTPEPASLALFGCGLAAVFWARRTRLSRR